MGTQHHGTALLHLLHHGVPQVALRAGVHPGAGLILKETKYSVRAGATSRPRDNVRKPRLQLQALRRLSKGPPSRPPSSPLGIRREASPGATSFKLQNDRP